MVDAMRKTLPLLVALLVAAVGCECQETVVRGAPPERVEVEATGLFGAGQVGQAGAGQADGEPIRATDYNPPIYRLHAHADGRFTAAMTIGWGALELLLPEVATDPTRYASGESDAFALQMRGGGMGVTERTVRDDHFGDATFEALLDGVRFVDQAPVVHLAVDLATGALVAEVSGTLVPLEENFGEAGEQAPGETVAPRAYQVRFDGVGKVLCWAAGQAVDDEPAWDSTAADSTTAGATGPCAELRDRLPTLPPTEDTPEAPWPLHPPAEQVTCGPFG
jgi:hypothetical protein